VHGEVARLFMRVLPAVYRGTAVRPPAGLKLSATIRCAGSGSGCRRTPPGCPRSSTGPPVHQHWLGLPQPDQTTEVVQHELVSCSPRHVDQTVIRFTLIHGAPV